MSVYACGDHHLKEFVVVCDSSVNLLPQLRVEAEERDLLELAVGSTAFGQGLRLTNLVIQSKKGRL